MSNSSKLMLLATLAMLAAVPAKADQIKFFSGTTGADGPAFTTQAGTVYSAIKNDNTACNGGGAGNCSGNLTCMATCPLLAGSP